MNSVDIRSYKNVNTGNVWVKRIVSPYEELKRLYEFFGKENPWEPGKHFFPSESNRSFTFFSQDPFGSDLISKSIEEEGTVIVDETVPEEVIKEAKSLGLKVKVVQLINI